MKKTKVYAIAQFLPVRLRQRMAAKVYDYPKDKYGEPENGSVPVCLTGRCPLGWLFADPPKGKLRSEYRIPDAHRIASRIRKLFPGLVKKANVRPVTEYDWQMDPVEIAAEHFTDDWDEGKISNLAKALGV